MRARNQVRCRACGEKTNPAELFCSHCGGSLRAQGYKANGHVRIFRLAGKVLATLLMVLVPLAAMAGFGFVIYHFFFAPADAETVTTTTTRAIVETTTSTTTPAPTQTFTLISDTDRYGTAIAISKQGFPRGSAAAVLVPGESFQEALCAAPLAKAYGGPLLFVPPEGLTDDLLTELKRLNPSQVFLVGIQSVTATKKALAGLPVPPVVTSLRGGDQYETAVLVANQLKTKLGTIAKVVIVPQGTFAHALAVAPLAAAQGWPILFTSENQTPPRVTRDAIAELAVASALVVGSEVQVDVAQVERVTGADQYDTCAQLAQYGLTHGMTLNHVAFATGEAFPDALAAAPYLALDGGLLLLTKGDAVPTPIATFLSAHASDIMAFDFIALPGLADQMEKAATTGTTDRTATTTTATAP
jgi:putative cell wall-binding protein